MNQYHNNPIAGIPSESLKAIGAGETLSDPARRGLGLDRHRQFAAAAMKNERGNDHLSAPLAKAASQAVGRVGILGANDMGMGIARRLLAADIPVTVYEVARAPLDVATAAMRSAYQESVANGELTAGQRDRRVALLAATVNLHHLKDCDVIVDTLDIDPDAKEGLIRRLNEVARPDAVLMTCVADRGVEQFAALARFPANVLGLRLPAGAPARQPWELVPGRATSRQALATAGRLVDDLGNPGVGLPPAMSLT